MPRHVFLTGITGFIAKRIALDLLNARHKVTGSLRRETRADEVRDAIRPHLTDTNALQNLTFITLDLTNDDGWTDAMQGCDILMHTASPFPMSSPKDENDVIRPAVDGTLRALNAAHSSGITRVILTSSVVAIEANDDPHPQTPANWTDINHPRATPYFKSKTLAEKAAWDFAKQHPEVQLTTINPSLVLGAPLDTHYGTSLAIVERIMAGKDPALPPFGFGIVDVTDVSAMHIAAMERSDTAGNRYIADGGTLSMPAIGAHLKATYSDRKIPTRTAPKWLMHALALVDPAIKSILPQLGYMPAFDTSASTRDLGVTFTPARTALDRAAQAVA